MPFVKLDCGILNSTLWFERDAREVFITALLMAEPFELLEPAPQIKIRSLEFTGWEVPPGWYGFVPAASVGIIHRAHVEEQSGLEAITRLGEPDEASRSKAYDGRRLIRINGGFLVLNFMEYRDRDYTSALRSARYRARKKKRASQRDESPSHRDITQAEAEVHTQERTAAAPLLAPSAVRKSSTPWKRALAIAHRVYDEPIDNDSDRRDRFKVLCGEQGLDYGARGGKDARPLFMRAMEFVEAQRVETLD